MHQHRPVIFHAGHRRPSPAVKWHHAARARMRSLQPDSRLLRASRVSTRRDRGGFSTRFTPILPVAVVATPSLHPPRTSPSRRDLSQPVAVTQVGGHHPARRQHGDHFTGDFLASMLPGPKRGEEPRGEGPTAAEDSEWGPEGGMGRIPLPVPPRTERSRSLVPGGAEGGAFRPTRLFRMDKRNAVSRVRSALTFREERRGWSGRRSSTPQGRLHRGGQGARMTHSGTMTASR